MSKEKILQQCTVKDNIIYLPAGQLDRKLYQEVAGALQLIGGKWKGGKVQGFVFPQDPSGLLAEIASGGKRNLKKEFQFFATPAELAEEMVMIANIQDGDVVLEPSAGQGAIMDAILRYSDMNLVDTTLFYCELMDVNRLVLQKKYQNNNSVTYFAPDFLAMKTWRFDRIIANPPFSKNQDIDHIYKMYDCLSAGGRMVSIASTHWMFSAGKKEQQFRDWINGPAKATIKSIARGYFSESGTKVASLMIIIDK